VLYEQVRHIAGRLRTHGFYSDSLSPTDLAHEAMAKILGTANPQPCASERHFLNLASLAMHQLLVDRLRRRQLRGPALEEIARKTVGLWENAAAEGEDRIRSPLANWERVLHGEDGAGDIDPLVRISLRIGSSPPWRPCTENSPAPGPFSTVRASQ
jgi:DNA-directed RNA polymerase specialized sigma24 family protein